MLTTYASMLIAKERQQAYLREAYVRDLLREAGYDKPGRWQRGRERFGDALIGLGQRLKGKTHGLPEARVSRL